MWMVTLIAGVKKITLGPFEKIDEAADAALSRPDIDSWSSWEFSRTQAARAAWEPPDLSYLGVKQYFEELAEGV